MKINKKYNKNKKGDATFVMVSALIMILSFFVILGFFTSSSKYVASEIDDIACRALISAKDNLAFQVAGEFTKAIGIKCKKDVVELESVDLEDVYKDVADYMGKCWYRYGEGEYDFLSRFNSEGDWCFTCAKIEFKDGEFVYPYSANYKNIQSFVEWTQKNKFKTANGTEMKYSDYFNMKYVKIDDVKELEDIQKDIDELKTEMEQDPDAALLPLIFYMGGKNMEMVDLANKQIDTNDKVYIVYRYERLNEETMDVVGDVLLGMGAGLVTELAVESAATFLVGATIAIPKATFKGLIGAAKFTKYSEKIAKLSEKIGSKIKYSKASDVVENVKSFDGSLKNLDDIAQSVKETDSILSKRILDFTSDLRKHGITDMDKIDVSILSTKDDIDNVLSRSQSVVTALNKKKQLNKNLEELEELKKIGDEIRPLIDNTGNIDEILADPSLVEKINKYLKLSARTAAVVAGGSVTYAYNSNYRQYVDILTPEQYYRSCGTEPIDKNK